VVHIHARDTQTEEPTYKSSVLCCMVLKRINNSKMKVLIFTEGGSSIGFGHITRCQALLEAFKELNVPGEIFVNGDENSISLPSDNNVRRYNWIIENEKLSEKIETGLILKIKAHIWEYIPIPLLGKLAAY